MGTGSEVWGRNASAVSPVPRANLLVGKLWLLHQTGRGCAKEISTQG